MITPSMKTLLFYSGSIFFATWAGGLLPLLRRWHDGTLRLFVSFGAGVLLGVAFMHLIPEAAELMNLQIGIPLLSGFLLLYILEKFVMVHSCEAGCDFHVIGWSAVVGLSVHSLTAGMALGAGLVIPEISLFVFFAILLHKLPESFSLTCILLQERMAKGKIILVLFGFSLAVPLGGVLTSFFLKEDSTYAVGWLLAFSAGTFLHIAADDLLPGVHAAVDNRRATLSTFLVGVALVLFSHAFYS